MRLDIVAASQLNVKEAEALDALHAAVHPPQPRAQSVWSQREWALPQWHIMIRDVNGKLISHVGASDATLLMRQQGDRDRRNWRCNDAPVAARQGLRWRRDKTGDRIPAARFAGRYVAPLLRPSFAELLSTLRLQQFLCRYLCTAKRRKDTAPAQRDHGDARHETRAEMRGAGLMWPSLVIAAALHSQPGT